MEDKQAFIILHSVREAGIWVGAAFPADSGSGTLRNSQELGCSTVL